MKKISTFLTGLLGLLFFILIGFFLYKTFNIIIRNIEKIDINIFVAVIGGTITICSFFITKYLDKKKTIENDIRNKKIPIYEEFIKFYFSVVHSKISSEEIVNFFQEFNQKAIVWFPDETLIYYIEWRKKVIDYSKNNSEEKLISIIFFQEDFLKQFRKDIGHSNKNILKGDISSLYLNDIEKYL